MHGLADLIKQDIDDTISRYDTEYKIPIVQNKLDGVNKNLLAHKILYLPHKYVTILFLKHYFRLEESNISKLTDQPYVAGCLHYSNELLCFAMGLPAGSYIHEDTLKKACQIALTLYYIETIETDLVITLKYSKKFRHNLKMLPAAQVHNSFIAIIGKRVAMIALVALLSFATTLAVSAEIRERFFYWVRNTFPQFTEFGAADTHDVLDDYLNEKLSSFKLNYIPNGFYLLNEPYFSPTTTMYDYANDSAEIINFMCHLPSGDLTAYDTEGAIVEEIEYRGQPAFIWYNKGLMYLVWQQEGYECSIVANLSKSEVFLIADSVTSSK